MTPEEIQQALEKLKDLCETSRNQEAKELAYELIEKHKFQEDSESLAKLYNTLGKVYSNLSDYPKALEYQSKALQIIEVIGNQKGIATVIANIGEVHFSLGLYDKALENTANALKIF